MYFTKKLTLAAKVLQAIALRRRTPLLVGWNVTYRCNLRCPYCVSSEAAGEELETRECLRLVDEMADAGVRLVTLSGGEPYLRRDLESIVSALMARGIRVTVNTNGTLVRQRPRIAKMGPEIKLSLDGPADLHDAIRGAGVHDKVIDAIRFCKDSGAPVALRTVIGQHNVDRVDQVLEIAQRHDVDLFFQPAYLGRSGPTNDANPLAPDPHDFRAAIERLIERQAAGERRILNSPAGLRHLAEWPGPKPIFCLFDRIGCCVEPDGRMFGCDNFPEYHRYLVSPTDGFRSTFERLSLPHQCDLCWCESAVETNLVGSLNPGAVARTWRRLGRAAVQPAARGPAT